MRVSTLLNKLINFKGLWVKAIDFIYGEPTIRVAPRTRVPRCSCCGRKVRSLYDSRERKWRDLSAFGRRTWLVYTIRRVSCPRCGVKTEAVPWARRKSGFTKRFENEVAWLLQRADQTAVCRYFGISWETAGKIAARVVREYQDPERLDRLRFIGVDEISYRKRHRYLTVVVDHETGELVWSGEGKGGKTLEKFFQELGPQRCKQLLGISMDMSEAYIAMAKKYATKAEITLDRFHVVNLIQKALDEVRREAVRELPVSQKSDLKKTKFVLLKNPWNLSPREKRRLSYIEKVNQPLYRAYLLKEEILRIYEYKREGSARKHFQQWYKWAVRSRLKSFRKLAKTLKKYLSGILAFIRTGLSNGRLEGMNNKIRLISHRAFGFHSAESLQAMAMLCCSNVELSLPTND